MMSVAIRTHVLQMYTFGPAMSFSTSFSFFPQKEQRWLRRICHLFSDRTTANGPGAHRRGPRDIVPRPEKLWRAASGAAPSWAASALLAIEPWRRSPLLCVVPNQASFDETNIGCSEAFWCGLGSPDREGKRWLHATRECLEV